MLSYAPPLITPEFSQSRLSLPTVLGVSSLSVPDEYWIFCIVLASVRPRSLLSGLLAAFFRDFRTLRPGPPVARFFPFLPSRAFFSLLLSPPRFLLSDRLCFFPPAVGPPFRNPPHYFVKRLASGRTPLSSSHLEKAMNDFVVTLIENYSCFFAGRGCGLPRVPPSLPPERSGAPSSDSLQFFSSPTDFSYF